MSIVDWQGGAPGAAERRKGAAECLRTQPSGGLLPPTSDIDELLCGAASSAFSGLCFLTRSGFLTHCKRPYARSFRSKLTMLCARTPYARLRVPEPQPGAHNEYLRVPDALLLLPDGAVVMISDREANAVLVAQWDAAREAGNGLGADAEHGPRSRDGQEGSAPQARLLVNLSSLRRAMDDAARPVPVQSVALQGRPGCIAAAYDAGGAWEAWLGREGAGVEGKVAAVQVWAGETAYGTAGRRAALRGLVRGHAVAVLAILDMRGLGQMMAGSDLEAAADTSIYGESAGQWC